MIEIIVYIVFGIVIALFVALFLCLFSWIIFESVLEYKKSPNKIVYLENLCDKFFSAWTNILKILGIIMALIVIILLAFGIAQIIVVIP